MFIAPEFLTILALSLLFAGYHDVGVVAGVFYGLTPAVIAVVLEAVVRLRRRALTERAAVGIALAAFVAIFVFRLPFPLIVLLAAVAGVAAWKGRASGMSDPAEIESELNVRPSFVSVDARPRGHCRRAPPSIATIALPTTSTGGLGQQRNTFPF